MVTANAKGQLVPRPLPAQQLERHVEPCEACQGHVAPGKTCYACGRLGAAADFRDPNACELHGWTGELGACRECNSAPDVDRRITEQSPPPLLYTDDYRAGYLAGHSDSRAGTAPPPGDSAPVVLPPHTRSGEEFVAGYDAAVCAHRLGCDVRKMIDDDTLEAAIESVPAIVDRLLVRQRFLEGSFLNLKTDLAGLLDVPPTSDAIRKRVAELVAVVHIETTKGHGT